MLAIGDETSRATIYLLDGMWLTTTSLYPISSFLGKRFEEGGNTLSFTDSQGMLVLNSDLDDLLSRACQWASGYLKNNPNISKSDRALCDDVSQ